MSSTYSNLPYPGATSPRQCMDLHVPSGCNAHSPLLVYVHGGAWRSDSKDDLTSTLMPFLLESAHLPVANLEYRLAPNDPHPAQVEDIITALRLLSDPAHRFEFEDAGARWDRNKIYFIGHSAGAFMGATILLKSLSPSPLFTVTERVRQSVAGIIGVDGIYDLALLLGEYPTYAYFIEEAFGKVPQAYIDESPARWGIGEGMGRIPWLVLHSKEDELLSLQQPRAMIVHLVKLLELAQAPTDEDEESGRLIEGKWGSLEVDFASITGKHEALPLTKQLAERIARWVEDKEQLGKEAAA